MKTLRLFHHSRSDAVVRGFEDKFYKLLVQHDAIRSVGFRLKKSHNAEWPKFAVV